MCDATATTLKNGGERNLSCGTDIDSSGRHSSKTGE